MLPFFKVKEHDAIVGEKGVLFGQLMKRNDELSLLYDKIRIQTSSLHQGEVSQSPVGISKCTSRKNSTYLENVRFELAHTQDQKDENASSGG